MRRKGRLLQSSILTAALFVFAVPALAAEPAPGGACTTLNYIIETGGPETSGVRNILRCDGTNWQQEMTIEADGSVTLGNTRIGTGGHPDVAFQEDEWGNTFVTSTRSDGFGHIYLNLGVSNSTGAAAFVIDGSVREASSIVSFVAESGLRLAGDITPAQITANKNNYNPTGLDEASVLRLSSDASRNITSLAGGADGRIITIMNIGSFPIVLKNDDGATGTAANRFALTGDLTLAAKQSAMLMYDSTASRWRQIANGTASGSGDNLGNHTATQNIVLGSNWLSGDGGNEGVYVDGNGNTTATEDLYVQNDFYVNAGSAAYFSGSVALTGDISPAQITANQNDYNPANLATTSVLRLSSDASRNITSLAGGSDGRIITIMNIGSFPIVLKNDDGATGTAANRFALTGDLTLAAKQSAMLMYDSTASRWRQIANGTATGSGDNLGNHTATQNIILGSNWLSGDGGNEGIQIDSSGNVGIDTPPAAGTRLSMADSGGGVAEIATLINSSPASAGTGVGIVYQGPSSIKLGSVGAIWEDGTGNNSGLYFNTRNTTYSSKMYLSASGNLGIGSIGVPKQKLHVFSSNAYGTGMSVATDGVGAGSQAILNLLTKSNGSDTLGDATSAGWQIWANGDGSSNYSSLGGPNTFGIGFAYGVGWSPAALQILSNGNVGIGTHAAGTLPGAGLDIGLSLALSGDITPAQIAANQNNYNPTGIATASVLRLSSDASRTITGIVGGVDGRVLTILNVGTNPIVLSNQNTSSTAANRFAAGADITIGADQSASLIYDATSQRWRSAFDPFRVSFLGSVNPSPLGDGMH